jgi:hypothetical protein
MNLAQFFEHWRIAENPFKGEEARTDSVFARIGLAAPGSSMPSREAASVPPVVVSEPGAIPASGSSGSIAHAPFHSDFDKILGDLSRPSTSIVFGEKGSGKTAIRLQTADRIAAHNAARGESRILMVAYDDLNGVLDRFHRRVNGKTPLESFQKLRLADHIDAIIGQVVPRIVDTLLTKPSSGPAPSDAVDLGNEARKRARKLDLDAKRELLLLQAVYDRPDVAEARTARLRSLLRVSLPAPVILWTALAWLGWIPAAAMLVYHMLQPGDHLLWNIYSIAFVSLVGVWLAIVFKRLAVDRWGILRLAHRVRRQIRVQQRSDISYARSLGQLDPVARDPSRLPLGDAGGGADDARYALLERLRRTLSRFGYSGLLIVVDRVDEPTLISGDADRMRAVVWPMLNNKFLQAPGVGVKMLLPIELRHALFKESTVFFQEARLDKQHLVERLSWTGAMLYDLCDARLKACLAPGSETISLVDLFEQDVTRKDLIDALDQMHQPRDAFKFLYACIAEHCSNVTSEQQMFKVPRLTLETVRKQQSERVQQLYRGIRPA